MPKIKLPVSGQEVEYSGLSYDDADKYLEQEVVATKSEDRVMALRALQRETLSRTNPRAWEMAKGHNRDAIALHRAVIKETFGDPDELGNSSRSGDGQQTGKS